MSELYNKLKYNIDKINNILSKKVMKEYLYKDCNWVSPVTGTINLYGVGKGCDGYGRYTIGQDIAFEGLASADGMFGGGAFCVPTTKTYDVVKGQSYEVRLSDIDQNYPDLKLNERSSTYCFFDQKIFLGEAAGARGSSTPLHLTPQMQGQALSISQQINTNNHYPLTPADAANGTGVGGAGIDGKVFVKLITRSHGGAGYFCILQLTEISTQGGKGGTGFLEVSYLYLGELISIDKDVFALGALILCLSCS